MMTEAMHMEQKSKGGWKRPGALNGQPSGRDFILRVKRPSADPSGHSMELLQKGAGLGLGGLRGAVPGIQAGG